MELFKVQLYDTLIEWDAANDLAHNTCKDSENYTSEAYASEPILTVDNKFGLVALTICEEELKAAGFNFLEKSTDIIKVEEV